MSRAYISVFFSLALSLCMSLIVGLVYGARESAIRYKVRDTAQISMESAFGEYEEEIWNRYNLIFIDMGYGNTVDSMILPEEHFIYCMNENFDEEMLGIFGGKDLLLLHCDDVETEKVRFLTDNSGLPIMRQAVEAMKKKTGISIVDKIDDYLEVADTTEMLEKSIGDEAEKSKDQLKEVETPIIKEWVEAAEGAIWEEKDVGLLSSIRIILKDVSTVSNRQYLKENLIEERELNKGNFEEQDELTLTDKFLYREYLLEYCGNYTEESEETVLKYETEYLITGRISDAENLEGVINRILLIREGANLKTLYSDTEKMAEIKTFSEALSNLVLQPELEPCIEILVASLLSYIESVSDVRLLLCGEKVPLIKTPDQWKTGIGDIFSKSTPKEGYKEGIKYTDYLRTLLYFQTDRNITKRFMNVVEENVRKESNNSGFRIDNCFDAWRLRAYVTSDYGYDYTIEKENGIGE